MLKLLKFLLIGSDKKLRFYVMCSGKGYTVRKMTRFDADICQQACKLIDGPFDKAEAAASSLEFWDNKSKYQFVIT